MAEVLLAAIHRPRKLTFKGCMFDDGWEFDAPCVLYEPVARFRIASNSGGVLALVEDVAFDLSVGKPVRAEFSDENLKEFKWRGWSPRGFATRRKAWHVEVVVKFTVPFGCEKGFDFEVVSQRERFGLSGPWELS